jgi:hypothetical protein
VRGFVKLPRAILRDKNLSAEAKITYALLCDAADPGDRQRVRISLPAVAVALGRSKATRDIARRAVRELITAGHLHVKEAPAGRCPIYLLTRSDSAPGTDLQPVAISHPTHSDSAPGTRSDSAPLRRRTLDVFNLNYVRTATRRTNSRAECPIGDRLIELLLELGWSSSKIRREAPAIHKQIGGASNEPLLVRQIELARAEPSIESPFAYAMSCIQAQRRSA